MKYDVTIGIPVYQSVDYIEKTMESALSQTFPLIEYLVVDDCGNDGSIILIEDLKKTHPRGEHIRILHNNENYGVSYSRNLIIDQARGSFLFFLDSDDYIEPNTIQLFYTTLKSNQSQIVYGSYEIIDTIHFSSCVQYRKPFLTIEDEGLLAEFAFKNTNLFHVSVCNFLIDTKFLRDLGLRFVNYSYWEDMLFTYELVTKISKAVLLPDITYHYIKRPNSLSHYQSRAHYDKSEIISSVSIINYLKEKCMIYRGNSFLPYMCYRLEMNSFYVVCYVINHSKEITPCISLSEMRDFMHYPVPFFTIIAFKSKKWTNLALWIISNLPLFLFKRVVLIISKMK